MLNFLQIQVKDLNTDTDLDIVSLYINETYSPSNYYRISGNTFSNDWILTPGNQLYVGFKTDQGTHYNGFEISVEGTYVMKFMALTGKSYKEKRIEIDSEYSMILTAFESVITFSIISCPGQTAR